MPQIPQIKTLTNTSVEVINAIRNSASQNYRDYVPYATPDADSIKEIGAIIMDYPALQNEFLSALINRIGRVLVTSKLYSNPWSAFKKGLLEMGEVVEDIFVNIAKPFDYDPGVAETNVFKRQIPDVKSAFHVMNYQKFYKATIQNDQLRQAFLSWDGVTDLIARIVDSMYSGAAYDEFQVMKYMLAKEILNGGIHAVGLDVDAIDAENASAIVTAIKGVSNDMEFMKTTYNRAGVHTYSNKEDQIVLLNSKFDAVMDVNVLATAFNMSKAEFMGRRVLVDSFGALDTARLNELFDANDTFYGAPGYEEIGQEDLALLDEIPAVLVDRDYFMIFDNLISFTENYNGEGLYWNYWLHQWKTFSVSPFANAAVFTTEAVGVADEGAITISPNGASVKKGGTVQLTASVETSGFASQAVNWTSDKEGVTVDSRGVVRVADTADTGVATITATSVVNPDAKAEAKITVTA